MEIAVLNIYIFNTLLDFNTLVGQPIEYRHFYFKKITIYLWNI